MIGGSGGSSALITAQLLRMCLPHACRKAPLVDLVPLPLLSVGILFAFCGKVSPSFASHAACWLASCVWGRTCKLGGNCFGLVWKGGAYMFLYVASEDSPVRRLYKTGGTSIAHMWSWSNSLISVSLIALYCSADSSTSRKDSRSGSIAARCSVFRSNRKFVGQVEGSLEKSVRPVLLL